MSPLKQGANQMPPSTPEPPRLLRSILPRVGSQASVPKRSNKRSRVGRACLACRQRRTRCSGEKPCANCVSQGIECQIWETKRAREKRVLDSLQRQNNDYEQLLQDISGRVGTQDAQRIQAALSKNSADIVLPQSSLESEQASSSLGTGGGDEDADCNDFSDDWSSVGSLGGADRIEQPLDEDEKARATGFMGKSSEITWLQRMGRNVVQEADTGREGLDLPVSSVDYHLDDLKLNTTKHVEPYELPSKLVADSLLDTYFACVHPSFPILQQAPIVSAVKALYDKASPRPGDATLALLQLLFAVAAKCSYTTTQSHLFDKRDHVDYFSRAKTLFVNGDVLLRHPDLQEIEFLGLLGFYLLSIGQVNRSWKVSGLCIRSAFALGLNLQDTAPQTASDRKEDRYRIWWSLFVLEHFLVAMTGRHSYITDDCHTTPLPLPFDDDQDLDADMMLMSSDLSVRKTYLETPRPPAGLKASKAQVQKLDGVSSSSQLLPSTNSWLQSVAPSGSLYFLYFVKLSLIAHEAQNTLYVPTVTQRSWCSITRDINLLQLRTSSWRLSLPESYDFCNSQIASSFRREKLSLAFLFHSIEIMLARPCLCRFDGQSSPGSNKENFAPTNATQCVKSACSLLKLIPEHVDAMAEFLEFAPWWCLSHYIMQATVVLLLELSMRSKHLPEEAQQVTDLMKRALRFFQQLSTVSLSADRCWRMCDWFIRRLAPQVSLDVSGLPYQQHFTQDKGDDTWTTSRMLTPSAVTNDFDEFLPFDPATGEITGSFFPVPGAGEERGEGSWMM